MAENRFEDIDETLNRIDALRDFPEEAGSPSDFLTEIAKLTRELADTAQELTLEDFNAEYEAEGDPTA